nr:MAG TPA: hypothetical protein [Caudoviricetes sp.]
MELCNREHRTFCIPLILLTFNRQGFIIRLEAIKDICGVQ